LVKLEKNKLMKQKKNYLATSKQLLKRPHQIAFVSSIEIPCPHILAETVKALSSLDGCLSVIKKLKILFA